MTEPRAWGATAAHARELVELSRAQGRELIIGYPWHFTPHTLRAIAYTGGCVIAALEGDRQIGFCSGMAAWRWGGKALCWSACRSWRIRPPAW